MAMKASLASTYREEINITLNNGRTTINAVRGAAAYRQCHSVMKQANKDQVDILCCECPSSEFHHTQVDPAGVLA